MKKSTADCAARRRRRTKNSARRVVRGIRVARESCREPGTRSRVAITRLRRCSWPPHACCAECAFCAERSCVGVSAAIDAVLALVAARVMREHCAGAAACAIGEPLCRTRTWTAVSVEKRREACWEGFRRERYEVNFARACSRAWSYAGSARSRPRTGNPSGTLHPAPTHSLERSLHAGSRFQVVQPFLCGVT